MYGKLLDRNRKLVEKNASTTCSRRNATPSTIVPEEQLREGQSDLASWTRGDRQARFEQTAERHAGLSQFAAPFLSRVKFVDEQGEGASPTLAALRAYREHRAAGRRDLPPDVSIDFVPPALQRLNRSNRFYAANRELGRALKTEFVLQYMSEPKLWAKVRRSLLKVEQAPRLGAGRLLRAAGAHQRPRGLRPDERVLVPDPAPRLHRLLAGPGRSHGTPSRPSHRPSPAVPSRAGQLSSPGRSSRTPDARSW